MYYSNGSIPSFGVQYENEQRRNSDARDSFKYLSDNNDTEKTIELAKEYGFEVKKNSENPGFTVGKKKKSKRNGYVQKVYWERNMLALLLANTINGSGWYYDEKAEINKRVISIDNGRITFHVPDDFDLGDLPEVEYDWDGHTNKEKWDRVKEMIRRN